MTGKGITMKSEGIILFALESSRTFGDNVAGKLGVPLSSLEERQFEDGEHKSRPLVSVRGSDVFVIQSLCGDARQSVNDKFCRLLFFIGAVKDASASRVTAVVPYLCYARKDRKSQPRDPVTTRYIASLFEAVGTDGILTLDVHNLAAYQNAFRCRADHLEARRLFVEHFAPLLQDEEVAVVSPDIGGIKRAEQFRQALARVSRKNPAMAFMEKYRAKGVVTGETIVGEVKNRVALIIDDLISTGMTISRAAKACRTAGAAHVHAAASHGVFVGAANAVIADPSLEKTVITDTIPPFRLDPAVAQSRLTVLDTSALFGEAIKRIHTGGSIVDLLES
jgi:ribose-phosphate pyrophosphokinase